MTTFDDPNREAVGLEPAWVEGSGGSGGASAEPEAREPTEAERTLDLDALTKDELLELAKQLGVSPANASMTKDDLRAGVEEKLGR